MADLFRDEQSDSTESFRIRTLVFVLVLGGLIGVADPLISGTIAPKTILAFFGGLSLWLALPFLLWSRNLRMVVTICVATNFFVYQACFAFYGDPFYIALGFAVPVGAALFMKTFDSITVLILYCTASIAFAVAIRAGWWSPPYLIDDADVALNLKQTLTGTLVIVAITVAVIWKEKLFADPTARERTQQNRFETICENGYDAIVEADENGEITFVGGRLLSHLGFKLTDVLHRHQLELICAGKRAEFLRSVSRNSGGANRYDLETKIYDSEDNEIWVRISGGSFKCSNGQMKWVCGVREIESQIKQRENLFEVSRLESLGSVCGGLAHDFNNLLTVIGIHADRITDPNVKRYILQAQEQATDLTSGLLTFSRKQKFREQEIPLSDFVDESFPLLRRIVKENIKFSRNIDLDDVYVLADADQLQQVLINLVTNCDHAMPNGGSLSISANVVDILPDDVLKTASPDKRYVVLRVEDSGRGMPSKVSKRAVEPFFTTKPRGKGTGLGLAMVHGIVQNAGGALTIESAPNKGTCVSIFLPYQTRSLPVPVKSTSGVTHEYELPSTKILLVEDRNLVGKAIQSGLELAGADVVLVSNAEEASELISSIEFDLLVSDLVLPGMNGLELINQAISIHDRIRAVLISGHQQQDLEFSTSHGDKVRFLPKPFATNDLLGVICSLLNMPEFDNNNRTKIKSA